MATTAESSSRGDKPVIVRVKRKAFQSRLDAFWLEINERPLKRQLLDFSKLSISESSSNREELKSKKVLVWHVETVASSEVTLDVLQSFVPRSSDCIEAKEKSKETRRTFKSKSKQDQLLVKAKQKQEVISSSARFEQIWRSRKVKKEIEQDEALYEMCRLYDIVRVDVEEKDHELRKKDSELEDHRMMADYLPLLREVLPSAAVEIENDIHDHMSRQGSSDDYVYDLYAVKDDASFMEDDHAAQFPLIQVDDDDEFYYGRDDSDYETDDSNAENNPLNDYPDEETSEEEDDEVLSRSSDEKSEVESRSTMKGSEESETGSHISYEGDSGIRYLSDNELLSVDDYAYSDGDFGDYDYDHEGFYD